VTIWIGNPILVICSSWEKVWCHGRALSALWPYRLNQSAVELSSNPLYHSHKKNIAIKQHFVRECVEKDYVELMCMSTEEMPADMLTKCLE
jgi:hypothetical protein